MRGLKWTPDGKRLAAVLQISGWDNIYLLDARPRTVPEALTKGDWEGKCFRKELVMVDGSPLHYHVNGRSNVTLLPYW